MTRQKNEVFKENYPNDENELRDYAYFSGHKRVWKRANHVPIALSVDGIQYNDLQ